MLRMSAWRLRSLSRGPRVWERRRTQTKARVLVPVVELDARLDGVVNLAHFVAGGKSKPVTERCGRNGRPVVVDVARSSVRDRRQRRYVVQHFRATVDPSGERERAGLGRTVTASPQGGVYLVRDAGEPVVCSLSRLLTVPSGVESEKSGNET